MHYYPHPFRYTAHGGKSSAEYCSYAENGGRVAFPLYFLLKFMVVVMLIAVTQ